MKKEHYHILLVDDHPLITTAYKEAFKRYRKLNKKVAFKITEAHSIDAAWQKLRAVSAINMLNLVFLDLRLPPSSDGEMLSGEDLGLKLREKWPKVKLVVATTFNDDYRIHSIFHNLNPEGFLIKNDITPEEMVVAIRDILYDPPYYSKTVIKSLRRFVSLDFVLDKYDRQLLHHLSLGTKMKDLPDILFLSMTAIEKRKRNLKVIFGTEEDDDRELLQKAREKGFI